MIAALFAESGGCYFGLPDVDPWDKDRDARRYDGPHPVVAHPPCERWGRYWHGAPCKPHQYELGADDECFDRALSAVRRFGGVLEHPADSRAWQHFGLLKPPRSGGWVPADTLGGFGGWTCYVEQGHYGHAARKGTWLYACRTDFPTLRWGRSEQRLPAYAIERYGYARARRIGVMAAIGGKDKTRIRNATPLAFRDVLITIAETAARQ
jgi:hypothetical protein